MNKPLKNIIYDIAIALAIAMFFITDRILKYVAHESAGTKIITILGNIFTFRFTPNYYIAFSIPFSGYILNILILTLIGLLIVYLSYLIIKNKGSRFDIICFTIMIGGAISNVIDRLAYGYVVDYLYLRYFTVFNLADVMISGGALALIIKNLKNPGK